MRSVRAASAPAPSPAERPARGGERPRVLVVDDEASIRELLSKTLALAEYDVDTAPDGRAAIERLRLGHYDLLIADLKMPGLDGLSLIREAKRLERRLAGDHHHRLLDRVERDRSGQPRRRRLSHQALPRPAGPRRRGARARRVDIGDWVI